MNISKWICKPCNFTKVAAISVVLLAIVLVFDIAISNRYKKSVISTREFTVLSQETCDNSRYSTCVYRITDGQITMFYRSRTVYAPTMKIWYSEWLEQDGTKKWNWYDFKPLWEKEKFMWVDGYRLYR